MKKLFLTSVFILAMAFPVFGGEVFYGRLYDCSNGFDETSFCRIAIYRDLEEALKRACTSCPVPEPIFKMKIIAVAAVLEEKKCSFTDAEGNQTEIDCKKMD